MLIVGIIALILLALIAILLVLILLNLGTVADTYTDTWGRFALTVLNRREVKEPEVTEEYPEALPREK